MQLQILQKSTSSTTLIWAERFLSPTVKVLTADFRLLALLDNVFCAEPEATSSLVYVGYLIQK